MSLLQNLPYRKYQTALSLTLEQCEIIGKLADLKISFTETKPPGQLLIKTLDRRGFTVQQYEKFLTAALNMKTISIYYKPQAKVAILIANDKYINLSKLITPSIDCDSLASNLKHLGFIVITIKNATSSNLKANLIEILALIPEDSYCFIFYAGHGCEICNTKCILCIDSPENNIELEHCVTENFILKEVAKCKPNLCVLIMDMCRIYLDRASHPEIYSSISSIDDYTVHNNLLISYSTQSSQAAYEVLQIECSTTIDNNVTYQLKTGDTDRIVPGASQYVNALCTRLSDNYDVSTLLDKVHGDVENSFKKQRPIKVQCGVAKRSLYDPSVGDTEELLSKFKNFVKEKDNCAVFG